jgi:hypothetical protein
VRHAIHLSVATDVACSRTASAAPFVGAGPTHASPPQISPAFRRTGQECPGLPGRPKVPGNLWEMFVKDACKPVDSPGEGGDCPDLGCGDSAGSVYLAGGQRFEGVVGFGDGVVGFLFWQPHWVCSFPAA